VANRTVLLADRIKATEVWLSTVPDDHYTIQLLLADAASQREIAGFIAANDKFLDVAQIRIYRKMVNGRDRLGVIYGDYPARELAVAALAQLGTIRQVSQPYVRPVSQLR
jgi:septal ring-binding cell division protein DamX